MQQSYFDNGKPKKKKIYFGVLRGIWLEVSNVIHSTHCRGPKATSSKIKSISMVGVGETLLRATLVEYRKFCKSKG